MYGEGSVLYGTVRRYGEVLYVQYGSREQGAGAGGRMNRRGTEKSKSTILPVCIPPLRTFVCVTPYWFLPYCMSSSGAVLCFQPAHATAQICQYFVISAQHHPVPQCCRAGSQSEKAAISPSPPQPHQSSRCCMMEEEGGRVSAQDSTGRVRRGRPGIGCRRYGIICQRPRGLGWTLYGL